VTVIQHLSHDEKPGLGSSVISPKCLSKMHLSLLSTGRSPAPVIAVSVECFGFHPHNLDIGGDHCIEGGRFCPHFRPTEEETSQFHSSREVCSGSGLDSTCSDSHCQLGNGGGVLRKTQTPCSHRKSEASPGWSATRD
jgi:hypothetical protein